MRARGRVADEVVLDNRVELAAVRRHIVYLRSTNGFISIHLLAIHSRAMCLLFGTVNANRSPGLETGITYPLKSPFAISCRYLLFSLMSRSKTSLVMSNIASMSLIILSPVSSPPISRRKKPVVRHVSNSLRAYVESLEDSFARENLGTSAVGISLGKRGKLSNNFWETMMTKMRYSDNGVLKF